MIHDMQFTKDYCIIADLPLEFNPEQAMMKNMAVFSANTKGVARYGFTRRDSDNSDDVIWINTPVHFCFHYINAYQEGNKVILHGCVYDEMNFDMVTEYPDEVNTGDAIPLLKRFEFDLSTKSVKITKPLEGVTVEFPMINQRYYGKNSRYCYLMMSAHLGQFTDPEVRADLNGIGFVKYDMHSQKPAKVVNFDYHCCGGEVLF